MVCATSKASDLPAHTRSLSIAFASRLNFSMIVKLLTEHHLEFLSLNGGRIGSSESTLVKMPHCSKSHVAAHLWSSLSEVINVTGSCPTFASGYSISVYQTPLCSKENMANA